MKHFPPHCQVYRSAAREVHYQKDSERQAATESNLPPSGPHSLQPCLPHYVSRTPLNNVFLSFPPSLPPSFETTFVGHESQTAVFSRTRTQSFRAQSKHTRKKGKVTLLQKHHPQTRTVHILTERRSAPCCSRRDETTRTHGAHLEGSSRTRTNAATRHPSTQTTRSLLLPPMPHRH